MKLFAYGTLRYGESNHHFLNGAQLIYKDLTLQAIMYDTGDGYPAIELALGSTVTGDVYEVPNYMWASLDELEGYSGNPERDLYTKQKVSIQTKSGELEVVVYTVCDETMKKIVIPSGDWIAYRKAHEIK